MVFVLMYAVAPTEDIAKAFEEAQDFVDVIRRMLLSENALLFWGEQALLVRRWKAAQKIFLQSTDEHTRVRRVLREGRVRVEMVIKRGERAGTVAAEIFIQGDAQPAEGKSLAIKAGFSQKGRKRAVLQRFEVSGE